MDCEKCPLEARLVRLREDLDRGISHSSEAREKIYNRLRDLETGTARTEERYKSICKDLEELKIQQATILSKIDDISNKPAKRWDNAVSGLVGSVIGAIVAFISQRIFGG